MARNTFVIGRAREQKVELELRRRGHKILFRNLRTLFSEVDIISLSPENELWMVEVKSGGPTIWRRPAGKSQVGRLARAYQHLQLSAGMRLRFHLVQCDFDGHLHWFHDSLADL